MKNLVRCLGCVAIFTVVSCVGLFGLLALAGLTFGLDDGDLVIDTTITVTEAEMNSGDNNTVTFEDTEFVQNAQYDIRDGSIAVSGDMLCEDGTRANGQLFVFLSTTDDGFIDVQITDVTADCTYDAAVVEQAQNEVAEALDEAARELEESNTELTFTDVSLENDELKIGIKIRIPFF